MRVGILCHPSMGGSGFLATQLGLALANGGHDVSLITYETPFLLQDDKTGHMIVDLVDCPQHPLFRYPPYTTTLISKIIQSHREKPFDLINAHYAIPHSLAAYMTRKMVNVPYVTTLHGSDVHLLGIDPAFSSTVSFTVQESDGITAVANFLAELAQTQMGITKPIEVIPNFVDCSIFAPRRPERYFFRTKEESIVTHVSNFRAVKRTLNLVKAFAKIVQQIPTSRLLLIGDGPERCQATRLAEKLGIKKHVRALGVRQDIPDILNETDVLAMPSQVEGCPLAILEAMSSAVPVVATRVGGIPEILKDQEEGYLVAPEDDDQLAARIIELLQDPEKRQRMGDHARGHICRDLVARKIVPRYIKLFSQVIS